MIIGSSSCQEVHIISGHSQIGELGEHESETAILRTNEIPDGEGQSSNDKEGGDEGNQMKSVFGKVGGQDELVDSGHDELFHSIDEYATGHFNIFFVARERIDGLRVESQHGHVKYREGDAKNTANLMSQGECDTIAHRMKMRDGDTLYNECRVDIVGRGQENDCSGNRNEYRAAGTAEARVLAMGLGDRT